MSLHRRIMVLLYAMLLMHPIDEAEEILRELLFDPIDNANDGAENSSRPCRATSSE